MSTEKYTEHYKKYIPIYKKLAKINGGKTVWIPTDEHDGWYISDTVTENDGKAWEEGFPYKSRPSILPADLSTEVERTAYTTITYAPDEAYKTKYYKKPEYNENNQGGYEWMNNDSDRLPDYGDMVAWALFVDIDIKKDYKERPISPEHKKVLENRLNLWVQAFSKMVGDKNSVQLLDSGGGVYVFTPPSILSPIANKYNKEDRELIFTEIGTRMREITGELNSLICSEDSAPDELFSADKVQNKNRQFKTIGAIHKSFDAVVHPIDPENINIEHKKRENITSKDISEAKNWVENFTDETHSQYIDNVIEYLFQGKFTRRDNVEIEYVEGVDWEDIIDTWLDEKKKEIERWEASLEEQKELTQEQLETELTSKKSIAREATRRLNNKKLKQYIVNFVGKDNVYDKSNQEMDFFPFWRANSTQSGRSAFYDVYKGDARFTDKADGTSRGIAHWVALEMTYDDKNYPDTHLIDNPGEPLTGYKYIQALSELRKRGENIPVLVEEPNGNDMMDETYLIGKAKEANLIDENEIITIQDNKAKDGERQTLIPSAYNRVLNKFDEAGIEHNCEEKEYIESKNITPAYEEYDLETLKKSDIHSKFYKSSDDVWLMPEFDSKKEFEEFMDKIPEEMVVFKYDDKISGGPADGILLGTFISDDSKTVTMTHFEFSPLDKIDTIKSVEHLSLKKEITLDKTKMTILVKPKNKRN